MDIVIKVGGIYCIALVIFHLLFWNIFKWNEELSKLNKVNRAIMQVLNSSLTIVFIIFAYISLVHTKELLSTSLGQSLLALISIFWLARSVQQIIFFKLEHWLSWAFLAFFLIGAVIYGIPVVYHT